MSATGPTTRSVLWAGLDTGGTAVLSMIAMLVIARFLRPDQFGVASLGTGLVLVMNLYVEGLLHDALIQKEDADESHFRAAFWLVILIGGGIFLAVLLANVALVATPLHPVVQLMALSAASLPFSGVNGVMNARLRRAFRYDAVAIPSVASKVFGPMVGVVGAMAGLGAWAIVLQFVASVVIQALMLLWRERWWPRFTLDFRPLSTIWGFALPYALMNTIVGLRIQGFTALVAASMGFTATGYMNLAFRLTVTPQILLQTALVNLGLPLLARRQTDQEGLEAAFNTFNRLVCLGMAACFVGLASCAPALVQTILGPKWAPSIPEIQIFALCACAYLMRLPSALVLRALGWVKYSFFNAIFHFVLILGGMVLIRPHQMWTAGLIWAAPLVFIIPATGVLVSQRSGISVRTQLSGIWAPLLSAAAMAGVVMAVADLMHGRTPPLILIAQVACGGLVYIGLMLSLDRHVREMAQTLLARRFPRLAGSVL